MVWLPYGPVGAEAQASRAGEDEWAAGLLDKGMEAWPKMAKARPKVRQPMAAAAHGCQ